MQDKALSEMDKEESPAESNDSDSEDAAVDREKALAEKEKVKHFGELYKNSKTKRQPCLTLPINKECLCSQGNAFFRDGKYDDAIECYTRGMSADPYNPVLPTNRATSFFRLKK